MNSVSLFVLYIIFQSFWRVIELENTTESKKKNKSKTDPDEIARVHMSFLVIENVGLRFCFMKGYSSDLSLHIDKAWGFTRRYGQN